MSWRDGVDAVEANAFGRPTGNPEGQALKEKLAEIGVVGAALVVQALNEGATVDDALVGVPFREDRLNHVGHAPLLRRAREAMEAYRPEAQGGTVRNAFGREVPAERAPARRGALEADRVEEDLVQELARLNRRRYGASGEAVARHALAHVRGAVVAEGGDAAEVARRMHAIVEQEQAKGARSTRGKGQIR